MTSWDASESEEIATLIGAMKVLEEKIKRQEEIIALQEKWLQEKREEVFDLKTKTGEEPNE